MIGPPGLARISRGGAVVPPPRGLQGARTGPGAPVLLVLLLLAGCKSEQVGEQRFVGVFRGLEVNPGGFGSASVTVVHTDRAVFTLVGRCGIREAALGDSCFVIRIKSWTGLGGPASWLVIGDWRYYL